MEDQDETILITKSEPCVIQKNNEVIQNSDYLYAKPFEMVKHVEVQPINDFEKNMLKDSKSVEQLLEEEKNEKPIKLTEEEQKKIIQKEYITKVKVIALSRMGKHPLANGSLLSQADKRKLIETMEKILLLTDGQIDREFNDVCIEKIFDPKCDYSTFPIYDYKSMIIHNRKLQETIKSVESIE